MSDEEDLDVGGKKIFNLPNYMRLAYPLKGVDRERYEGLKNSGMFWEWYPDATGNYEEDCQSDKPVD